MLRVIVIALLIYVGGYVAFRQTHAEVWERDKRTYVIFSESYGRTLYCAWRPLSYLDAAATGMQSITSGRIASAARVPHAIQNAARSYRMASDANDSG